MIRTVDAYAIIVAGDSLQLYGVSIEPVESELVGDVYFDVDSKESMFNATNELCNLIYEQGYRQQPTVVGLDGFQCLMTKKPESGLAKQANSLEILLEDSLPFDAENLVAIDYGSEQLLVAIKDRVKPFIDAVVESGIDVHSILPTSLFIANTAIQRGIVEPTCRISIKNKHLETTTCQDGEIVGWTVMEQAIPQFGFEEELPEFFVGVQTDETDHMESEVGLEPILAAGVQLLVNDKLKNALPSFDSFNGVAKKTPLADALRLVGISVAFLLIVLIGNNLWQSHRINRAVATLDEKTNELYRTVLPNAPPTRLIERTLNAEKKKLETQAPMLEKANSTRRIVSSLYSVVESIPIDYAIKVSNIKINAAKLVIRGVTERDEHLFRLKSRLEELGLKPILNEQEIGLDFVLSFSLPEDFQAPRIDQNQQSTVPMSL